MIYESDEHTCQYCGSKKHLSIDHVIPRCRGGEDTWENLVVACSSCNVKKGSTPLHWYEVDEDSTTNAKQNC